MVLTCPLAFPISKILDKILGEEMGTVYNKKRLIELLKVTRETNDLEKEEVDIVTGALIYKEKTVRSVMTGLSDCYLLNIKTVLNFETMAEIKEQVMRSLTCMDVEYNN
jgi:metal transporter CNNM